MKKLETIDESGWKQQTIENALEQKRRRGRPRSASSFRFKTVGLEPEDWSWLALWCPDGNQSVQLRELLDRAKKFWPTGPARFR